MAGLALVVPRPIGGPFPATIFEDPLDGLPVVRPIGGDGRIRTAFALPSVLSPLPLPDPAFGTAVLPSGSPGSLIALPTTLAVPTVPPAVAVTRLIALPSPLSRARLAGAPSIASLLTLVVSTLIGGLLPLTATLLTLLVALLGRVWLPLLTLRARLGLPL